MAASICEKDGKRREGPGEDDGPAGIVDAQKLGHQIIGHQRHLIGHEHQDHIKEEDGIPYPAPPAAEPIGGHRRHRHLQQHDGHHQDHRVPDLQQIFRAFDQRCDILGKAHLVRDELQVHLLGDIAAAAGNGGKDRAVVGVDLRLRHEGVGDRQHRWQQKGQGKQRRHKDLKAPAQDVAAALFCLLHPSTSFPKASSTRNKRAMMTTITSASITAAAESFW